MELTIIDISWVSFRVYRKNTLHNENSVVGSNSVNGIIVAASTA